MNRRQLMSTGATALLLTGITGCAPSKFKPYEGPPVTQIVVNKGARQMFLLSGSSVLKSYRFGLGWAPVGDKFFEGDGRTPEGNYFIDRRNPNSEYHLSLGVSYPDPTDVAAAATVGRSAGSDIFIHGRGREGRAKVGSKWDWTAGCITVSDSEMEDIYAMVREGTPIQINP